MTQRLKRQLVAALKQYLKTRRLPQVPEAGVLLWNIFMQVSSTRTYHMAGPHPISFAEIREFSALYGWPLQAHHVEIIRALDDAWLEHSYSKTNSKDKGRQEHSGELTADAFDAVFG